MPSGWWVELPLITAFLAVIFIELYWLSRSFVYKKIPYVGTFRLRLLIGIAINILFIAIWALCRFVLKL
jgi:hypothetical protein